MLRSRPRLAGGVRRFVPMVSGIVLIALGIPSSSQTQGGGAPLPGTAALTALHEFLKFQSAAHHTGDAPVPTRR